MGLCARIMRPLMNILGHGLDLVNSILTGPMLVIAYQRRVCSGTKLCSRILVGFRMVSLWKMRIVAVISVYRAIRFIRRNFKVGEKYVFA
jgi:hypothetical protein